VPSKMAIKKGRRGERSVCGEGRIAERVGSASRKKRVLGRRKDMGKKKIPERERKKGVWGALSSSFRLLKAGGKEGRGPGTEKERKGPLFETEGDCHKTWRILKRDSS